MKARLALLFGLALLIAAAGSSAATTAQAQAPAIHQAVAPTVTAEQPPAADPYVAMSDVTSSTPQARAWCPCILGVNCCGDDPGFPLLCGYELQCHCGAGGCVVRK